MPLNAKKPEAIQKRLKLFMYGPPGVGKTTAAIQFPEALIIDMERGTDNYSQSINKSKSAVLQTTDSEEVKQEIRSLLTEKHSYKTLIIDPITSLYNSVQEKWTRIFEKHSKSEKQAELQDFGMRYWGRVKNEYKTIQKMLMSLDMNVIITSHQKDIYGSNMQKIGVGPDSMKGDEYFFDYVFQLNNVKGQRVAVITKERSEIGKPKFPESFEWNYENFLKYYGGDVIKKESIPLKLASQEQVEKINELLAIVKIDDTQVTKWLTKAEAETFSDMQSNDIDKCIKFVETKLPGGKK